MTTEEKKIEEAAKQCPYIQPKIAENINEQWVGIKSAIWGIKSDAAKEYHTKGMYSKDQVFKLLKELQYGYHNHQHSEGGFDLKQWFNDNIKTA